MKKTIYLVMEETDYDMTNGVTVCNTPEEAFEAMKGVLDHYVAEEYLEDYCLKEGDNYNEGRDTFGRKYKVFIRPETIEFDQDPELKREGMNGGKLKEVDNRLRELGIDLALVYFWENLITHEDLQEGQGERLVKITHDGYLSGELRLRDCYDIMASLIADTEDQSTIDDEMFDKRAESGMWGL